LLTRVSFRSIRHTFIRDEENKDIELGRRISHLPASWHGKGIVRFLLLLAAAAAVAWVAAAYGIAHDYGYLRASILTGSPVGEYHALAERLSRRANRGHGKLTVVTTAGSVENVGLLTSGEGNCSAMFAFVQDGTPVTPDSSLELLGRLPEPESLLLLGKYDRPIRAFTDLRGASIGIGPEGSGTAFLVEQLFAEAKDLQALKANLSHHPFDEQAKLVAEGKLALAIFIMSENAEFLRRVIPQYSLNIVAPPDLQGLIARYPWLTLGRVPTGRYDMERPIPEEEKYVARVKTFIVASPCARRADRIALLMLLAAEIPGFVRANPPVATSPNTILPLSREAQQFFLTGEPEIADRYFPWLVNIMSPAYWVYLVMAVTVLFKGMTLFSRFRLWRIDAARAKLESALNDLAGPGLTHTQMRMAPADLSASERRAAADSILEQLMDLRARCQRQVNSIVTPMGDEMFYRYQQSLIDGAATTVVTLLEAAHLAPQANSAAQPTSP
jgi:uncharacterized protein